MLVFSGCEMMLQKFGRLLQAGGYLWGSKMYHTMQQCCTQSSIQKTNLMLATVTTRMEMIPLNSSAPCSLWFILYF